MNLKQILLLTGTIALTSLASCKNYNTSYNQPQEKIESQIYSHSPHRKELLTMEERTKREQKKINKFLRKRSKEEQNQFHKYLKIKEKNKF